jgi:signal transduction histidine kinase
MFNSKTLSTVFIFLVFFSTAGFSQLAAIENAKQKIYTSKTDAERLTNLVAIGKLRNSLHGDTIYWYAQWAKQLALQLKDNKALAWAEYSLISSDLAKGKIDSVIDKIENNTTFKNIKNTDTALYYKIQLLKANALNRLNKRTEALDLQLKLLTEAEKEGNINSQLFALNYIGATYISIAKPIEARQAWVNGLQIIKEKNNSENNEIEAYILSNLALYYFNTYYKNRTKELSDSFLITINKAIELSKQNENLGVTSGALSSRGNFYGLTNQFAAGENDFKEAVDIRKKIGDPFYISDQLTDLSNFYFSQKQYNKCIETAQEGINIANRYGIKGQQLTLFGIIGMAYKTQGNYEQYSKTLERLITAGDSSNRINSAEKIADVQTKYEVQKKETLIAKQKLDLWQRKLFMYGGGILTALLLIFLGYRFKKYQQQQKIKVAALMENEKQQNEIAVKGAEEKERLRISANLHDNLGVQANAILYNASLLKEGANKNQLVENLHDTAKEMLYNLRETLWAMKTTDVTAKDLWLRIINFMKQMGRHYTSITFTIAGDAPDNFTVNSNQALHIILVLQETVNNSVKHANAATITATSVNGLAGWQILLADDGRGFKMEEAKTKADSYGLSNMRQRANEGKFGFTIATAAGKGTVTTIGIPK